MSAPIYHNGIGYRLAKHTVNFGLRAYFGHIITKGSENLPHTPYILAPNHQNAFLDALLMLQLNKSRPTVFVARADIFDNTLANKVLRFLKIMPVYRARDGRQSLQRNNAVFQTAEEVLLHNVPFCMMAEGTHNNRRQLLPLKKGMFRIAFAARQQMGNTPLHIVPVGIDYTSYSIPGHTAIINIGKPIAIDGYMNLFGENNALAINYLKNDLRTALTARMHNIQSTDYYDEFYLLSELYARWQCPNRGKTNDWRRFEFRRQASQTLDLLEQCNPQKAKQIARQAVEIRNFCNANGVDISRLFSARNILWTLACALLVASLAVALALADLRLLAMVLLLCPIPFLPTRHLFGKQSDPQFVGSLNFALQFVLSIAYLVAMAACVWIFGKWYFALAALLMGGAVWRWGYVAAAWAGGLFADCKAKVFRRRATAKAEKAMLDIFSQMG